MSTIIVGAGEVGFSLANMLVLENRDVVVIDTNEDLLEKISSQIDVQTIAGHGASIDVLEKAGIKNAEMLVAVTDVDEVNMIAATAANRLGVRKAIARVRNPDYQKGKWVAFKDILGIDLIINPENEAAKKFAAISRSPGAVEIESFARGKLKFMHFIIGKKFKQQGKKLKSFDVPIDFIFAAIYRNDEVIIPSGGDTLEIGDTVYVLAKASSVDRIRKMFGYSSQQTRKIIIVGGGRIGFLTAQKLEQENFTVKVVERDMHKCEFLSENLSKAEIIHGDGTDVSLLKDIQADKYDLLIAVSMDDSTNIISCLLAKELGTPKVAALIQQKNLASFSEKFGIDVGVSPRLLTAGVIFKYLRKGNVVSVAKLIDGRAEVLELVASEKCPASGKAIQDIHFPSGTLVGAIETAEGEVIIPRGGSVINSKDHVILLVQPEAVDEISRFFI